MFPAVVEFQGAQLPIRHVIYNQATEGYTVHIGTRYDRSHVRPVTDIFLNTADNFPTGSIVVSYDPITRETVHVSEPEEHICRRLNAAGECVLTDSDDNISSDESGSEDTVREKRLLNKRVLKRVKIISEKLKYFNETTKKQAESLIQANNRQRAWTNHIMELLDRVSINMAPE
ncbi:uncharacterized protein LOC105214229 [Zeugodacus cucurbitae]|uniref:uncharacterized protein LOC105214229 n=1 Tax=Zeugodacus cucurbitae TaxID=28588 RepID=UPI0005967D28|nr:uncharacterized protein LOC105214229 [Zeugodacus cucurbitae]